MNKRHTWTDEQAETYIKNYQNMTYKELTDLINRKHQLNLTRNQVRHFGRKNGMTTRFNPKPFKKGNTLWKGGIDTQFKKGESVNELPLGTERVNADGYVVKKMQMKGTHNERWKFKHRLVWEKHNGKIPDDSIVVFLDKNRLNLDISNLAIIPKRINSIMNINKWYSDNPEETKVRITQALLISKRAEVERSIHDE